MKAQVKIQYYELLESSRMGDCTYCALILNSMKSAKAQIDRSNESPIVRVIARKNAPFYVDWTERHGRRAVEIYAEEGTA